MFPSPQGSSIPTEVSSITMTPEEIVRIRELPTLIANENNPERMKTLAAELEHLLRNEIRERTEKDGSITDRSTAPVDVDFR